MKRIKARLARIDWTAIGVSLLCAVVLTAVGMAMNWLFDGDLWHVNPGFVLGATLVGAYHSITRESHLPDITIRADEHGGVAASLRWLADRVDDEASSEADRLRLRG